MLVSTPVPISAVAPAASNDRAEMLDDMKHRAGVRRLNPSLSRAVSLAGVVP